MTRQLTELFDEVLRLGLKSRRPGDKLGHRRLVRVNMGNFFRGWRRTVGVFALSITLMFTHQWVRDSRIYYPSATVRHFDEFSHFSADNISYWCTAIPLGLLSVYLLLSKPRTAPSTAPKP